MNCKEAEKDIHLYKADELCHSEAEELKQHIDSCANCKEVLGEMEGYKKLISKLRKIQPVSINKFEFANDIMSLLHEDKSIPLPTKTKYRFIKSTIYRVASILIVLLSTTVFIIQNRSINQSIRRLEAKYEHKNPNFEFLDNYNECVDFSQNQIAQMVKYDMELLAVLENSARGMYPKDIERFAEKICQQPIDIYSLDAKEKKQLLFRLIQEGKKL